MRPQARALQRRCEREASKRALETEDEDLAWGFWKNAKGSDFWPYLRGKFELLANEERESLRSRPRSDCGLRAYCRYNQDMTPGEAEMTQEGHVCLLFRPESGTWSLSRGPSEYLKARFEALSARAGSRLRPPPGVRAADFWLHCICVYLREGRSPQLFACSDTGGIIISVCESSATYCCWLERNDIETSALETSVSAPPSRAPYRRAETSDPDVARRRVVVRNNSLIKTRELCGILDRERIPLPD